MEEGEAIGELDYLFRSRIRANLIVSLSNEGSVNRDSVKESVECDRTTVQRNLDSLVERGYLENTGKEYSTTLKGSLFADMVAEILQRAQLIEGMEDFLQYVDPDDFDMEISDLSDAEIWLPEPPDPYAMINRHVEVIEQSNLGRLLLPVIGLQPHVAVHENVLEGAGEFETVVTQEVAETWTSDPRYREMTREMVDTERFRVFVYEGDMPYFLGLFDRDLVQVGVDDEGTPKAMLEATAEPVVDWAEDVYTEYRVQSEELTVAE